MISLISLISLIPLLAGPSSCYPQNIAWATLSPSPHAAAASASPGPSGAAAGTPRLHPLPPAYGVEKLTLLRARVLQ
jgi:hypothetical protein